MTQPWPCWKHERKKGRQEKKKLVEETAASDGVSAVSMDYRLAKTHTMRRVYKSFSAQEPYDSWLFCGKRPAIGGTLCIFATLEWTQFSASENIFPHHLHLCLEIVQWDCNTYTQFQYYWSPEIFLNTYFFDPTHLCWVPSDFAWKRLVCSLNC